MFLARFDRLIRKAQQLSLLGGGSDRGLVPEKKTVVRGGKAHQQTFWEAPKKAPKKDKGKTWGMPPLSMPWTRTRADHVNLRREQWRKLYGGESPFTHEHEEEHHAAVADAVKRRMPIPYKVLKDYPALRHEYIHGGGSGRSAQARMFKALELMKGKQLSLFGEQPKVGQVVAKADTDYKLHYRTKYRGIPVSVENRRGSYRRGTDRDGTEWATKMQRPYGRIPRTQGADGDALDVFLGPEAEAPRVYVAAIRTPGTKRYDEDKLFLGFAKREDAERCFRDHYDKPGRFLAGWVTLSWEEFERRYKAGRFRHGRRIVKSLLGAPYVGPRGGRWADPDHKTPWRQEMSEHEARGMSRMADRKGKHGGEQGDHVYGLIRGDHTRTTVPIEHLDAIEPGDQQRVGKYADRKGVMPPIRVGYNARAAKRGNRSLFVADGNHRVAAAKKRGHSHIEVYMPAGDLYRWNNRGEPPRHEVAKAQAQHGPFVGPKGGKWANPEHTIPWHPHVNNEAIHGAAHEAVKPKVVQAAHRAAAAGAHAPSMGYFHAGGEGILFKDKGGRVHKVGRQGKKGQLRHEAAALHALSKHGLAPKVHGYDEKHDVISRDEVKGRPGAWADDKHIRPAYDKAVKVLSKEGFGAPEYKEDSFIMPHDGGSPQLVDAGFMHLRGKRLADDLRSRDLAGSTDWGQAFDAQLDVNTALDDKAITHDEAVEMMGKIGHEEQRKQGLEMLEFKKKHSGEVKKAHRFVIGGKKGLTAEKRQVTRGGKTFQQTFYVRGKPAGKPKQQKRAPAPQESKHVRQWVDHVEGLPLNTAEHYKDKAGNYSPERQKLHQDIIVSFVKAARPVPEDKKPVAVLMMGGPASGKTTAANTLLGKDAVKDYVSVNQDDIKEHLPEYQQGLKAFARDAANMVHKESSEISADVYRHGFQARRNLLLDGTGNNSEKYARRIKALKDAGYHVRLLMADVDPGEALKRMQARAEETGRYVPEHVFWKGHKGIPGNFHGLASMADEAALLSSDDYPPTPVWTKGPGGEEKIHNGERYQQFRGRASGRVGGDVAKAESDAADGGRGPGGLPGGGGDPGRQGQGRLDGRRQGLIGRALQFVIRKAEQLSLFSRSGLKAETKTVQRKDGTHKQKFWVKAEKDRPKPRPKAKPVLKVKPPKKAAEFPAGAAFFPTGNRRERDFLAALTKEQRAEVIDAFNEGLKEPFTAEDLEFEGEHRGKQKAAALRGWKDVDPAEAAKLSAVMGEWANEHMPTVRAGGVAVSWDGKPRLDVLPGPNYKGQMVEGTPLTANEQKEAGQEALAFFGVLNRALRGSGEVRKAEAVSPRAVRWVLTARQSPMEGD